MTTPTLSTIEGSIAITILVMTAKGTHNMSTLFIYYPDSASGCEPFLSGRKKAREEFLPRLRVTNGPAQMPLFGGIWPAGNECNYALNNDPNFALAE